MFTVNARAQSWVDEGYVPNVWISLSKMNKGK